MSGIRIAVLSIKCPHCGVELDIDRDREFPTEEEQALYVEGKIDEHLDLCIPTTKPPFPLEAGS